MSNTRDCESCGGKGTVHAITHKDDNGTHSYIKCDGCGVTTLSNKDLDIQEVSMVPTHNPDANVAPISFGNVTNMSIGFGEPKEEMSVIDKLQQVPGTVMQNEVRNAIGDENYNQFVTDIKAEILRQLVEDLEGEEIPDTVKDKLGSLYFEFKVYQENLHNTLINDKLRDERINKIRSPFDEVVASRSIPKGGVVSISGNMNVRCTDEVDKLFKGIGKKKDK